MLQNDQFPALKHTKFEDVPANTVLDTVQAALSGQESHPIWQNWLRRMLAIKQAASSIGIKMEEMPAIERAVAKVCHLEVPFDQFLMAVFAEVARETGGKEAAQDLLALEAGEVAPVITPPTPTTPAATSPSISSSDITSSTTSPATPMTVLRELLDADTDSEAYPDTLAIAKKMSDWLETQAITAFQSADFILNRFRAALSKYLRDPQPWDEMRGSSRVFVEMENFLKLEEQEKQNLIRVIVQGKLN